MIEPRQVAFFGAKLLLTGRTSSDAALAVGVLAGSLPHIFIQKYGYSVCALWLHTCLIPLMSAVGDLHEKRPALPEKLKELQTKGRKLTQTQKNNGKIQSQNRVHIQWLLRHRG